MRTAGYYVYMLTDQNRHIIKKGVSRNLRRHLANMQRLTGQPDGNPVILTYFELFSDIYPALDRVRQLEARTDAWLHKLISEHNRDWKNLFPNLPETDGA